MNLPGRTAVESSMRTLLLAAMFATGLSFALPAPHPTMTAAGGSDGGKKKKDKDKEEDVALRLTMSTAAIS